MKGKTGRVKRKVTFYLDEETFRRLKVISASRLISMSRFLTELINSQKER